MRTLGVRLDPENITDGKGTFAAHLADASGWDLQAVVLQNG